MNRVFLDVIGRTLAHKTVYLLLRVYMRASIHGWSHRDRYGDVKQVFLFKCYQVLKYGKHPGTTPFMAPSTPLEASYGL